MKRYWEQPKIEQSRLAELKAFTRKYPMFKSQLGEIAYIGAVNQDGMPSGTSTSDPTQRIAEQRENPLRSVKLIEKCAKDALPVKHQVSMDGFLFGLVHGIPPDKLRAKGKIRMGSAAYYLYRDNYYRLLDGRKKQ